MAQNVTIAGNQYPDVPSILVPKTGGGGNAIFADPSVVTAVAADVASGKYFLDSSGVLTQGTASGGGSSSWTKVAEESYVVNTTSTSYIAVGTLTCSEKIFTNEKIVYIKVRDTAGRRTNYFYGSDTFITNGNGDKTNTSFSNMLRNIWKYTASGFALRQSSGTTVYGVAAGGGIASASPYEITIQARYDSSYSGTINGTYKVEVYLIDMPNGTTLFP